MGVHKVEEEDVSKVENRGEEKRQQGMQLRRKGRGLPKIDAWALFFPSFFVAPDTSTPQPEMEKEMRKLSKFQRIKALTKNGPGEHHSGLGIIFL